jgi:subtilisin-like proprotein convertase family protein
LPWTKNAANHWFHDWYGFGRVNVDAAVAAARAYVAGSLGTLTETNWAQDSGTINVTVPTGSSGVTRTLSVSNSLVIEAVQARVSVTGCAADVGLELTSPAGTVSYLMNVNSGIGETNISNHRYLSNAFLDENSSGTWTLRVIEGKTNCTPVLTNWKLNFFGH